MERAIYIITEMIRIVITKHAHAAIKRDESTNASTHAYLVVLNLGAWWWIGVHRGRVVCAPLTPYAGKSTIYPASNIPHRSFPLPDLMAQPARRALWLWPQNHYSCNWVENSYHELAKGAQPNLLKSNLRLTIFNQRINAPTTKRDGLPMHHPIATLQKITRRENPCWSTVSPWLLSLKLRLPLKWDIPHFSVRLLLRWLHSNWHPKKRLGSHVSISHCYASDFCYFRVHDLIQSFPLWFFQSTNA